MLDSWRGRLIKEGSDFQEKRAKKRERETYHVEERLIRSFTTRRVGMAKSASWPSSSLIAHDNYALAYIVLTLRHYTTAL